MPGRTQVLGHVAEVRFDDGGVQGLVVAQDVQVAGVVLEIRLGGENRGGLAAPGTHPTLPAHPHGAALRPSGSPEPAGNRRRGELP